MKSVRRTQTGVAVGLMAIMVNVGVVQGISVAAASSPSDPVAVARAAGDTDPHLPLTAQTLQREAEKFAAATTLMGQLRKAWAAQPSATQSPVAITPNSTLPGGGGSAPTSAYLAANQQAQQTTYWCGPAAVSEALGQRGYSLSQASAASQLQTTTDGTAWSGVYVSTAPSTGYPVADVMNNQTASTFYVPIAVSNPATTADKANYQPRLVTDVLGGWPLIGDAYEVVGGPHLVGHPDSNIMHWFDIRGYANSGVDTLYEDSVAGSTVSWAAGVPAYSSIASDKVVSIMGGRGYIW